MASRIARQRVVIDTGPLLALIDARDRYHAACAEWFERERSQLLLPVPVITEVGYQVGSKLGAEFEAEFLSRLSVERRFTFCSPGRPQLRRMAEIMTKYAALNLGTADVSVMAIAEQYGTTTIATVDRRDFGAVVPGNGTHYDLLPDPL